jgi:molybdopterin-guanine dinucleotide biosynthesis protein
MKQPFLIGIGGAHSGAGKTTIAVAILKYLKTHPPIYPFTHPPKIGAIKYTKTAFYLSIIDDKSILRQEDKDTKRLLDAGAEEVLWVQSPANEINEVLPIAIDRLSHLDGIIIEGNSAIEFLKPDVVVFIADVSKENIKPSAQIILKQSDIVIEKGSPYYSSKNIHELINCIEMTAKKKEIENILKTRSAEGKITCSDARTIAEELGVPYKEVGKTANELKIKIKNCELGCF